MTDSHLDTSLIKEKALTLNHLQKREEPLTCFGAAVFSGLSQGSHVITKTVYAFGEKLYKLGMFSQRFFMNQI